MHSQFGGTWLDNPELDKSDVIQRVGDSKLAAELNFFRQNGYLIRRGAIEEDVCDNLRGQIERVIVDGHDSLVIQAPDEVNNGKRKIRADEVVKDQRIVDCYVHFESALSALCHSAIEDFTSAVLAEPPLLFQSLSFIRGSNQGMHQDTAYVVVSPPMKLIAVWIALEDVTPGAGELMYEPGSHYYPEFLFGGKAKEYDGPRDGVEEHKHFEAHLAENIKSNEGEITRFLPKKGDILFWHADLYHGGSPVENEQATRYSIVGHYTGKSCIPNYYNFAPQRSKTLRHNETFYSSYYYDIEEIKAKN